MCTTKGVATSFELNKRPPCNVCHPDVIVHCFVGRQMQQSGERGSTGLGSSSHRYETNDWPRVRRRGGRSPSGRRLFFSRTIFSLWPFFSLTMFFLAILFCGHFFRWPIFFLWPLLSQNLCFLDRFFSLPCFSDHFFSGQVNVSPREVSNGAHKQTGSLTGSKGFTHMSMQWGQFLDHDITFTPNAGTYWHNSLPSNSCN